MSTATGGLVRWVRGVTFDVNGTLVHAPRLGAIYAETLARHGVDVAPADLERTIPQVWQELSIAAPAARDRFAVEPGGARAFWRRFLDRLCAHLGVASPGPFAVAELFRRFATAEAWEVYPEVEGVLAELAAGGLRLAVVSNWDERLPGLLAELGLARRFVAVVSSSAVGFEKPHPAIFRAALAELGLPAAGVVHVGDRRLEDLEGARAAGLGALLLDRSGGDGDLASLAELPARLRHPAFGRDSG